MKNPVRVKLANGDETTVDQSYAENHKLQVLTSKPAVDKSGRVLPAKSSLTPDQAAAAKKAESDIRSEIARAAAKKATARKTAASEPADGPQTPDAPSGETSEEN